jgi:hypothetical protein
MRKSTLLLSTALLGTAAASCWLWNQLSDERALNLDLKSRIAALEQPREPVPVAAEAAAGAVAELPAARVTKAMTEPRPAVPADPVVQAPGKRQQRLLKSPEFRKALRIQQRQVIENAYRDLPKVLNLSPEQADRVFDLLADQGVRTLEQQWSYSADRTERASLQDMNRERRKQNDAEMAKLLGEANTNRLNEFRASFESRNEVSTLRNELAGASEPLREDQIEPMVSLVYVEQQRMDQEMQDLTASNSPGAADPSFERKRSEIAIAANQRIVESANSLLTSVQLAALKDLYRRQRLQMEAQNEMNRLRFEAMTSDAPAAKPDQP